MSKKSIKTHLTLRGIYQYGKAKALLNDEENISLLKVALILSIAYIIYLKFFSVTFCTPH